MTTKPTYHITPALRFPDFLNDGEWRFVHGNELFEPIVNKNHNSDLPVLAITQDQGAVPRDMIDYNVIVSDKSIAGYKVVEVGDFIISLRSFQGGIEYSYYKGLCSPAYIVLRRKNELICNDFYRHYFKSARFIQDLNRNLEGIRDGKMVSYQQFSEIMLPFPPLPEQRRIAQALTALDELIAATNEKLEQMKAYKKGLMQQLFVDSMGGKSLKINYLQIPKLRFPEFYQEKEWEEKKLGEIIITITPKKKMQTGDYKLTGKHPIIDQSQSYICGYCDDDAALANSNSEQMIVFGDHTCTLKFVDFPFIQGADGIKVFKSSNSNVVDERFLYQFLLFNPIVSKEYKRHFSELKEKTVCLPVNVSEQRKIALCLSSMDETINAYTEKADLLVQYKKGLMQQTFPQNQMN
ncbi:MAG: restriction endonuclease subunit S [Bacteroidales bacterium]|nr:restriction endonuclease subunit S [Bacteroidales bacterium]MBR4498582.1 restriction endonuclease subunit S [Bacteroidales bacterium]